MINEDTGLIISLETCEYIYTYVEVCSTTLGDLYNSVQLQFNDEEATLNRFNFQRHLDYNIKYYDLSAELIEKKQATSLCNAQGVYYLLDPKIQAHVRAETSASDLHSNGGPTGQYQ